MTVTGWGGMTREQELIKAIEDDGHVPMYFKKDHSGAHLCPEWDFMLIWNGCSEMDACICDQEPYTGRKEER